MSAHNLELPANFFLDRPYSRDGLTVGAVYEGVNELEAGVFAPPQPRRGGCANKEKGAKLISSRRRGGVGPSQKRIPFLDLDQHHPGRSNFVLRCARRSLTHLVS